MVTSPPTDVNGHSGAWGVGLGSGSNEISNGLAPGANGMSCFFSVSSLAVGGCSRRWLVLVGGYAPMSP